MTKAEDAKVVQSTSVDLSRLSISEIPQPLRPGYSSIGRKIVLRTNYFPISPAKNLGLYAYSLSITPQEKIKAKRMRTRAAVLYINNAPFLQDPSLGVATDYSGTIVTTKRLSFPGTVHQSQYAYYDEEEDGPRQNNPINLDYKIEFSKVISVGDLMNYLMSTSAADRYEEKSSVLQALNIVLVRKPSSDPAVSVGGGAKRNKFFPHDAISGDLGGGLLAIRGYYTSVRTSTLRLLLNVNVVTAAFYQHSSVYELINAFGADSGKKQLGSFLKRLRIRLKHLEAGAGKKRVRTIQGISDDNKNATNTRFLWNGTSVTVQEYFRRSMFSAYPPITP